MNDINGKLTIFDPKRETKKKSGFMSDINRLATLKKEIEKTGKTFKVTGEKSKKKSLPAVGVRKFGVARKKMGNEDKFVYIVWKYRTEFCQRNCAILNVVIFYNKLYYKRTVAVFFPAQ